MTDTVVKQEKKVYDENYWMTVLIYFASFLIGLGIVAEIAFNWELIPDNVKLGGALVTMIANALALIWAMKKEKNILKQVLACVYAFLIMGVIGLIGQVFQLESDFVRGCLAWSAVSWPLFLVAPRLLWLWLPIAFVGVDGWVWQSRSLSTEIMQSAVGVSHAGVSQLPRIVTVYCYLCLFGAYEIWVNLKKKSQDNIVAKPLRFWSAMVLYNIYSQTVFSLKYINFDDAGAIHDILLAFAWILPYLVLAGLVWWLNSYYGRKSFMPYFLSGLVPEFLIALTFMSPYFYGRQLIVETGIPVVFVAIMALYSRHHKISKLQKFCYALLMIWFVAIWNEDILDVIPFLIVCGVWAYLAYRANNKRWFNVAVLAAVLRILGHYADVDNLQFFGVYLIGSGILLLVTLLLLKKYSKLLWENRNEK